MKSWKIKIRLTAEKFKICLYKSRKIYKALDARKVTSGVFIWGTRDGQGFHEFRGLKTDQKNSLNNLKIQERLNKFSRVQKQPLSSRISFFQDLYVD